MLDTSTLILLPLLHDTTALPVEPLISTITLAELSVGPLVARTDAERAARQAHLQQAEADVDPLPFDAAVVAANGIPLSTCNLDDFVAIAQLEVVGVPHPDT